MLRESTAKEVQNMVKRLRLNSWNILDLTNNRLTCHLTFLQPVGALKSECQFARLAIPTSMRSSSIGIDNKKKPIIWRGDY